MKLNSKEKLLWEVSKKTNFPSTPEKRNAWNQLVQRMKKHEGEKKVTHILQGFSEKIKYSLKLKPTHIYALFTVIITFFLISTLYQTSSTNIVRTKTTEREVINLIDGSIITVHSDSEITYDDNYNKTHRKIFLTGEAYFNVREGDFPLIVETKHAQITVLGTIFNVRSRNDGFEIGVNEGKVNISNEICIVELSQGQFIETASKFNKTDIQDISYSNYPDWLDYRIFCNKTRLLEVCSEIERIFDIKFIFQQPDLKNIIVTGMINSSDLQIVMKTLSILTDHDFKLLGDTVTII